MSVAAGSAGTEGNDLAAAAKTARHKSSGSLSFLVLMLAAGCAFGLLAAAAVRGIQTSSGATPTLEAIPASQLSEALISLGTNGGGAAVTAARTCVAPLAYVTVMAAPGAAPGRIRIRSGAYVSPTILVSDAPRRIAIPFPSPYPTGRGVITIEGAAKDLRMWLSPIWQAPTLAGAATISVTWVPAKPC